MNTKTFLPIAEALLTKPTAPFHEEAVREEIMRLLSGCKHVNLKQDEFGNLVAHYRRGKAAAHFAFAAHMDHPAYVGRKFLGGVPKRYLDKKAATQKFGAFSMWDLPPFQVRNQRIYSRACDDLIGCSVIVAMLLELEKTGTECSVYGLFTRAEEVGFVGAIQLATSGLVPRKIAIISLETSSQKGGPVKMGAGVIVRAGDRSSVFDSGVTIQLATNAQTKKIPYQRALMQGGSCEATAYVLYGYRVGGLCVALGNYHNCGPSDKIAAEYVSLDDTLAMTQLCIETAKVSQPVDPQKQLRERLETNMEKYRELF